MLRLLPSQHGLRENIELVVLDSVASGVTA